MLFTLNKNIDEVSFRQYAFGNFLLHTYRTKIKIAKDDPMLYYKNTWRRKSRVQIRRSDR